MITDSSYIMSLDCLMSVTLLWRQAWSVGIQLFKVETLQLDGSMARDYKALEVYTDFFPTLGEF